MPTIERNADSWALAWDSLGVAMGVERLTEAKNELRAEVTVESGVAGRVVGPVSVNLLSSETQTRFANACAKRVNGLTGEQWHAIVVQACAIVAKQYREPTPTLDLSTVETSGEIDYLVPGLVPTDETTVLYADGESAKSLLALRIAASVVVGSQLPWGDRPTRTCPVLYLDWETNPRTIAGRLDRIAAGMYTQRPQIHYRQVFRPLIDELPHVRVEVAKLGIGLVVVDSIGYAAHGSLIEDETARAAMNALRHLSPATRLVIAHVSAETARQTSGTASPFGSRFFWNSMRSGLELRKSDDQSDQDDISVALYHRKANDGEHHKPISMNVMFDGRRGPIAFVEADINDSPDLAARTPLSTRLRALLHKHNRALTIEDLADEIDGANGETISRTLRRMPDVIRVSEGNGRGHLGTWGLAQR